MDERMNCLRMVNKPYDATSSNGNTPGTNNHSCEFVKETVYSTICELNIVQP